MGENRKGAVCARSLGQPLRVLALATVVVALAATLSSCGRSDGGLTVTVVNSTGEDLTLQEMSLVGGGVLEPEAIPTLLASSRSNHSLTGPEGASVSLAYIGPEGKNATVTVTLAPEDSDRDISCSAVGYDCDANLSPTVITFLLN